mmetsp:Transcript_46850/g.141920  ORF Transcript_46850/g.141920 Transcript_46850/m.141920 type:complete len:159 (-) Transcript_46850:1107-1583(-)
MAAVTSLSCPLCRSDVDSAMCCPKCDSLEGMLPQIKKPENGTEALISGDADAKSWLELASPPNGRLYGFEWSSGLVAPFVPAPRAAINAALDAAGVGPGSRVIDLGCGDGRICIAAAKLGARAIGCDLNSELLGVAIARAATERVTDLASFVQNNYSK